MATAGSITVDANITPRAVRTAALDMACRAVTPGSPIGHFFSTARQFESYLLSGLTQTGPRFQQGAQVGAEGVSVLIDGENLTPEKVDEIRAALAGVL